MDKLAAIKQQKQQLKKKIMQLQGQKIPQNHLTQQAMAALYERKARIQHQRLQQQKYKKMEQQYSQRKAQAQRQKHLQRIRNQKRMIQLQVGMKRIVLNGVQQKVKGINSDQLLTRAMLNNPDKVGSVSKYQINKSKQDVKDQFSKYLQKQQIKKEKPKHDLYQLNEKRFQLFQRKQQLLMRQILLKQIINQNDNKGNNKDSEGDNILQEIDVMKCSKQQLQRLLQQYGIDIQEYMHPVDSEMVLENYPLIESSIKHKLKQKRKELESQEQQRHRFNLLKNDLREWTRQHQDQQAVRTILEIIDELLYEMVFDYEKRHFSLTKSQKSEKISQLKNDYQKMQFENEFYQLAEQYVAQIQSNMRKQVLYEATEQIHSLHEFAHEKASLSFDWVFEKGSFLQKKFSGDRLVDQITLTFKDQSENIRYDKADRQQNQAHNKDPNSNIFQTERQTSQLINDISLLAVEESFFREVYIQISRQIVQAIEQDEFKVHNQNGMHVITSKGIRLINQNKDTSKDVIVFQRQLKNIKNVKKFNNMWIIQTSEAVYIHSPWNMQRLSIAIGQRINSPSGNFTNFQIYPTFSLLGSLCTILMGFQKGQILKYNFNRNRINSVQTNLTHYLPLGPAIKTGDQPAFPLNNRNVIQYNTQKAKQTQQIHEFRQFFYHHSSEIINVCYYKQNTFITVDKSLNCAIWFYDMRRGPKSYQPFYEFQIRSQYKIYKQSQNSRFQDLYPSANVPESPEELYRKWMQHQTYLKLQIYNNPKKKSAFFKTPKWNNQKNQQPIWKINYDDKNKTIIKIFQTYYNVVDGKIECKEVKVWRQYLIFLVEREHAMRNDLKTVKIYTWSIQDKKLRTVAIQFDTFQEQKFNKLQADDFPIIAVISSGKILMFSMLSGQLLKDISEQLSCAKVKNYNFYVLERGKLSNFYGITRRSIVQFVIRDKNSKQKKDQFNKTIGITRKKYNNLI